MPANLREDASSTKGGRKGRGNSSAAAQLKEKERPHEGQGATRVSYIAWGERKEGRCFSLKKGRGTLDDGDDLGKGKEKGPDTEGRGTFFLRKKGSAPHRPRGGKRHSASSIGGG